MTHPTDSIEFASLLCSRLCHDLLSPVGALNNGLELMADETDPQMRERCLELLSESARTSANKLKFFRLAFGSAGGFGDAVPPHEARVAIEGMFATAGRVKIGWMGAGRPPGGRGTAQSTRSPGTGCWANVTCGVQALAANVTKTAMMETSGFMRRSSQ